MKLNRDKTINVITCSIKGILNSSSVVQLGKLLLFGTGVAGLTAGIIKGWEIYSNSTFAVLTLIGIILMFFSVHTDKRSSE